MKLAGIGQHQQLGAVLERDRLCKRSAPMLGITQRALGGPPYSWLPGQDLQDRSTSAAAPALGTLGQRRASLIPSRLCGETVSNECWEEAMSLSDELAYMSAAELARCIRQRQLSPVEVVDATIARIEARNPALTAFVYFGFDDARKAAQEAERALMAGEALGPLHGVPAAIKDLF